MDPTGEGVRSAESRKKPRRGPRLRAASFEDHKQIDRLGSRYGLKAKSYEEWSHLWLGNPVYREVQARWPIGWVLKTKTASSGRWETSRCGTSSREGDC